MAFSDAEIATLVQITGHPFELLDNYVTASANTAIENASRTHIQRWDALGTDTDSIKNYKGIYSSPDAERDFIRGVISSLLRVEIVAGGGGSRKVGRC